MKKLTEEDCINWWLEKYHNTNLTKVLEEHSQWQDDPPSHSREFYEEYAVTNAQHDEWHKWFIDAFAKNFRISKARARKHSGLTYLNVAPNVRP